MSSSGDQNFSFDPPAVDFDVLDIAGIRDPHTQQFGIYLAACYPDSRYHYSTVSVFESSDQGVSWHAFAQLPYPATMGFTTAQTSVAVHAGVWDLANTITVQLSSGSLESLTELEVLNGDNRAVLGQEIIGFQYATLVDVNTYTLSKLLRGLRGTEQKINTQVGGDRFVQLNSAGVVFVPMPNSALKTTRWLKAVPTGARIEDIPYYPITYQGKTIQTFAPCQVKATRDGSNNLSLTWVRRTRAITRLFSPNPKPQKERWEEYVVDYLDPSNTTVKRSSSTLSVTTPHGSIPVPVYSAANQTTDGYTPGNPVYANIYRLCEATSKGGYINVHM